MVVISVVNTKGGSGKTTTAMYLASAAVQRGMGAKVVDTDPQGTASSWYYSLKEADGDLGFDVVVANATSLKHAVEGGKNQVTVIDTPPGESGSIRAALEAADFVVVPSRVANADIWRAFPTLDMATHRPAAVLLTQARKGTRSLREVEELFQGEEVSCFETTIPQREAISSSVGEEIGELFGYDEVLSEILDFVE